MSTGSAPREHTDANESFERLYELHHRDVYGAALRELRNVHDAEDVTQTAFVDAYRAMVRGQRPASPRAWLLAIAENVLRRRFRTRARRPREEPLAPDGASTSEVAHEQVEALRHALAGLPRQQREVFVLREVSGLSYDEIAERAETTVASVQMLLFRARQALRSQLEPPSVARPRRKIAMHVPAWLVHFVGRAEVAVLTPKGAAAVGAMVVAVGGGTAGVVIAEKNGSGNRDGGTAQIGSTVASGTADEGRTLRALRARAATGASTGRTPARSAATVGSSPRQSPSPTTPSPVSSDSRQTQEPSSAVAGAAGSAPQESLPPATTAAPVAAALPEAPATSLPVSPAPASPVPAPPTPVPPAQQPTIGSPALPPVSAPAVPPVSPVVPPVEPPELPPVPPVPEPPPVPPVPVPPVPVPPVPAPPAVPPVPDPPAPPVPVPPAPPAPLP